MFRKLSLCIAVLWLSLGLLMPVESRAVTPPDLLGTWTGTVNKVTPAGFANETIILRVLQQWGKYFKGDITVGGVTVDFVSILNNINATTYDASFFFDAWKLDGSYESWCNGSYINNPTQIQVTNVGLYQRHDENLSNTVYDSTCILLRQ